MALQKIFCPSCKQSFFASDRIGALVVCANCEQSLEVTADSVRVCQPATPESAVQNFQKKPTLPAAKSFHAPRKPAPTRPAESATQPVSPPELESKSPSSRLSFGIDQLQTAVWKFILPVGLAFVFVATVTTLARQALKRPPAEESRITLRNTSPVKRDQVKGRMSQNQRSTFYPPPSNTTGSSDPVQKTFQSVAVVYSVIGGSGSGFVVDKNLLVTNCHVIEGMKEKDIRLRFPDSPHLAGEAFTAGLVAIDPVNDLAVLSFEADVPPLLVNKDYQYRKGQRVTAIGTPGTGEGSREHLENLPSSGRLGPPAEGNRWSMQLDINPGNSGGPVVSDKNGEVVAVVVEKYLKTEGHALAVPHPILIKVIESAQNADSEDIRNATIELRIRNFFHQLCSVLIEESIVFRMSLNAYNSKEQVSSRVLAFNQCKREKSSLLSRLRAELQTQLASEINLLTLQGSKSGAVIHGLKNLYKVVDQQSDKLSKSLSEASPYSYLNELDASFTDAWNLAREVSELLHAQVRGLGELNELLDK